MLRPGAACGRWEHEQPPRSPAASPALPVGVRVVGLIRGTLPRHLCMGPLLGQGVKMWLGQSAPWSGCGAGDCAPLCSSPLQESAQGFQSRPWHLPVLPPDVLQWFPSTAWALWLEKLRVTYIVLPQGAECALGWLLTQHKGECEGSLPPVWPWLGDPLAPSCGVAALCMTHCWQTSPGSCSTGAQQGPKCSPSPSSAPSTSSGHPLSEGLGCGRASAERWSQRWP